MLEILSEDECNDTYDRIRMYQALTLRQPENVEIPSERTVYRIMEEIGISHPPKRKPNGITKADREARKSDDLLKRDFHAEEPLTKCVTDITEMKGSDGKRYVSALDNIILLISKVLEAARTIWNKIQRVDILKAEKTDGVSHTAEDKPLSDTESPDIKTEDRKPVSRKDVIAEIPKADLQ